MGSILAGMFISLGAVVYLKVGGIAGALLFSVGLMSVLYTQTELFTGKARLLVSKELSPIRLIQIWIGNFAGCCLMSIIVCSTPIGAVISGPAAAIAATKAANSFLVNMALGIGCGMLMTTAVEGTTTTGNWLFAIIPVATFILIGFNHCVADMFYILVGGCGFWSLIPTTLGNIIGCCTKGIIQTLDTLIREPEPEEEVVKTIGFSVPREPKPKEETEEQKLEKEDIL